jgi:Domain of unknown function (DUF3943)
VTKKSILLFLLLLAVLTGSVSAQPDSMLIITSPATHPWYAAGEVVVINVITNRYNAWMREDGSFAYVSWESWKKNLQTELEWDWNGFATNFIGHPYQGSTYFNTGRSLGLEFWESAPYAVFGSLMWEYLGETHPPSYNDLVTTSLGGIYLGEMLHRLSEQILDDRSSGSGRIGRELSAAVLNPSRAFNRLVSGRASQTKSSRNHIRMPASGHLALGGDFIVKRFGIDNRPDRAILDYGLLYGDPFSRFGPARPFDFFTLRSSFKFTNAPDRKIPYLNIYSYGSIFRKVLRNNDHKSHAVGLFQHFDYIHNPSIEIGAMSFSGSFISKYRLSNNVRLTSIAQLGPSVLSGAKSEYVEVEEYSDDPGDTRDYIMGPGVIAKFDLLIEHDTLGQLALRYAHWSIFTQSGPAGSEHLNIVSSRYSVPVWKRFGLGVEWLYFNRDALYDDYPDVKKELHEVRSFVLRFF